jgi:hypothetical protein
VLVQRLNSQLEDQGISLRLTSHPHPVRQGNPTISYTTAGLALGILEVCKPNHPVQSTFVKVEIPSIGNLKEGKNEAVPGEPGKILTY